MAFDNVEDLFSVERGEVDRRAFSSEEIFEMEMDLIFGRAWLFLCHESQLKQPGDFFEAPMGRDNVLVVRQKDGTIKALLNSCTHRGNAVCRAEEGNTRNFMCTYHGWTFALSGDLVGVPGLKTFYEGELDKSQLGLREIPQFDSYKGFLFGTMDATAPPLVDFLGATGRLGIDLLAAQGNMEVVPGIQKFVIDCNWKFAQDNLFDWYHPQVTHMSAAATGLIPRANDDRIVDSGGATTPDGTELSLVESQSAGGGAGEMMLVIGEYGHAIAGPHADSPGAFNTEWRSSPEVQELLGPVGVKTAGHPGIFPNSWITVTNQLSLRVPRGPRETEIWYFSFVDRSLSEDMQAMQTMILSHIFGPAGLLEQDDGENWSQSTNSAYGVYGRTVPHMLKMNLGRGKVVREGGLAHIVGKTNEHAQRWFYTAWAQWLRGTDWESLKVATQPPDLI